MGKKVAGTGKTVGKPKTVVTGKSTITLSSKNYSSWSLSDWLLARFSGLKFEEVLISPDENQCQVYARQIRRHRVQGRGPARFSPYRDLASDALCARPNSRRTRESRYDDHYVW
jgi:hypothetical protein